MKEFEFSPINGVQMGPGIDGRAGRGWWERHFPMVTWLFNPYTGQRRDYRDVTTDPTGLAIVAPGEPLRAAQIPPRAEDRLLPAIEAAVAPAAVANATPRVLADDGKREDYPMYDGLLAYFPAALAEVARWSVVGNRKHNPGEPLHWSREKSTDHENKIIRHLLDARQVDKDGFVEAVALAWRALALCQTILEERGWAEGANARRKVQS